MYRKKMHFAPPHACNYTKLALPEELMAMCVLLYLIAKGSFWMLGRVFGSSHCWNQHHSGLQKWRLNH
jgi:hypothetical protein